MSLDFVMERMIRDWQSTIKDNDHINVLQLTQQKHFHSVAHSTVMCQAAFQVFTCAIWLHSASSCSVNTSQLAVPENLHLCLLNCLRDTGERSLIQTTRHISNVFSFNIPVLLLLINLCFIFDHRASWL